jgi:type II secretory ATPase GspE/PulE/Tfp pilus assembly ATPase PilB-like protein
VKDFAELAQAKIDPAAAALLPLEYCLEQRVAVLGPVPAEGPLSVAALDAEDVALSSGLSTRLGRPIRLVQFNAFEIGRALARIYGLPLSDGQEGPLQVEPDREIRFEAEQSAPRLLEDLLSVAVRRRATDVHIERYADDADLRFRIDGVLHQVPTPLSPDNVARVVSRLKVLCGADLAERRRAQDGSFRMLYGSRRIDVRATFLPGANGEDAALRLLDPAGFILDLEGLTMPADLLETWRGLSRHPHGLLLTAGPTGSGKTTTLYATVASRAGDGVKIVTAEDPVETVLAKVNQKAVSAQMGFADHLRAFLRANPDVMLVGEIRDPATAEIALRAATTGHLILSSLHTADAPGAIGRLRALGAEDDLLAETLLGVLGQRLLRRICEACRRETPVDERLAARYFDDVPSGPFYRGAGCERCEGTGYRGLVGAFELFRPDDAARAAIAAGRPVDEIRRLDRDRGGETLLADALRKAEQGLTSLEEVARKMPPRR